MQHAKNDKLICLALIGLIIYFTKTKKDDCWYIIKFTSDVIRRFAIAFKEIRIK